MAIRILFLLFSAVLLTNACKKGGETKADTAAPASAPAAPAPTAQLPSIPLSLLENVFMNATQVDYIFYYYPFTVSLTEKPSIQSSVRHIAEAPASQKPECKPAGRVTYQIQGDIVLEGDFYFSNGCTYFVFYENQQQKYANMMTDEGINSLNTQIQQAQNMRQGN
jgi:hypothetical protein